MDQNRNMLQKKKKKIGSNQRQWLKMTLASMTRFMWTNFMPKSFEKTERIMNEFGSYVG